MSSPTAERYPWREVLSQETSDQESLSSPKNALSIFVSVFFCWSVAGYCFNQYTALGRHVESHCGANGPSVIAKVAAMILAWGLVQTSHNSQENSMEHARVCVGWLNCSRYSSPKKARDCGLLKMSPGPKTRRKIRKKEPKKNTREGGTGNQRCHENYDFKKVGSTI